jgi:hypothetical protein
VQCSAAAAAAAVAVAVAGVLHVPGVASPGRAGGCAGVRGAYFCPSWGLH